MTDVVGPRPLVARSLSWAPNGKYLAVVDGEPLSVFLHSLKSGETRRLTLPPDGFDTMPSFSPDGRMVAFSRFRAAAAAAEIFILDLTEKLEPAREPRRLTEKGFAMNPLWTPDGREIIFREGESAAFWMLPSAGSGEPEWIYNVRHSIEAPAVATMSPRRRRLAYAKPTGNAEIWRIEVPEPGGQVGPALNLVHSSLPEFTPRYSPDGKRVAFASMRSGNLEIWVCDSDGSNWRQLTRLGAFLTHDPAWSPDGTRIAFESSSSGQKDIFVMDAQGGRPTNLTNHLAEDSVPSWSRDGKWVYFASTRSGQWQVWKMPPEGGEAIQVTRDGGYAPSESSDGRTLYYVKNPQATDLTSLWKISPDGGEESLVLSSLYRSHFAVVQDGIFFVPAPSRAGIFSLEFISFADETTRQITVIDKPLHQRLSASPDGRYVLCTVYDSIGSDLVMLEGF